MSENENAPTVTQPPALPVNPFQRQNAEHVNAGAVTIESERAIAEAQAKMVIAKRFPRDEYAAMQRILSACSRESLAQEAFYSYDRGGSKVTGPSIRLAEVLASCWGNVEYGINELSRRDGESEMQAYCWDLETNTYSQQKFTVAHLRDKRGGGVALTEQRDIYEIGANMGARRLRARILAIIPKDVIDTAEAACKATLAGGNRATFDTRLKRVVAAFNGGGVTLPMLEARLGKKRADATVDDLADLTAVYNSLKEGAQVSEYFGTAALAKVAAPADDRKPDQRQESANSQAKSAEKSPQPAASDDSSKKGRPSKEETDAARADGAAQFRAGAPFDSCPQERPSIMAAWRDGWEAEKAAAAEEKAARASGGDDGGVPFETGDDEGDAGSASGSAPAIKEPATDDDPDLPPAHMRRTAPAATAPASSGTDDFDFGE